MTSKVQGNISNYSVNRRGFASVEFKDSYCHSGYLRESSALGNVWLGVDDADVNLHLSRDNVRMLLPFLQNFANDGTILGDDWESEERKLAVEMRKMKNPATDVDENDTCCAESSSHDEETSQTRKRSRGDNKTECGVVCAIKAPIPETEQTKEK